jgi:hypothetical protein
MQIQFPCVFGGAPICSYMAKIAQGLTSMVPKEKFLLSIEFWIFNFFSIFVFAHGFV